MVVKTGEEICEGKTHPLLVSMGYNEELERKEKWYLASDVDKRVAFYDEYKRVPSALVYDYPNLTSEINQFFNEERTKTRGATVLEMKETLLKYNSWFFNFCFSNLDKDFEEMIK